MAARSAPAAPGQGEELAAAFAAIGLADVERGQPVDLGAAALGAGEWRRALAAMALG